MDVDGEASGRTRTPPPPTHPPKKKLLLIDGVVESELVGAQLSNSVVSA